MIKLLIVDDSALMRRVLGNAFKAEADFEIEFAHNGQQALEQSAAFRPHVITLDVNMPLMDGLTCLDRLMVERPCPVVMVSSETEAGAETTFQALKLGAVDFIAKPRGAISLSIDEFAPLLIEKVRQAAKAKLRSSHRLAERVRSRASRTMPMEAPSPSRAAAKASAVSFQGSADTVVLIGASTGGPPALETILSVLPAEFPWPVVVAQHMPAPFTGPMARRLDRLCPLSVIEVTQPTPLAPGHIYIGRGDADVIVAMRPNGAIVMSAPSSDEYRWHPSVDRLVSSAIQYLGAKRLVGVLLTGMGNDGAAAMTQLRDLGGHTIAEAEETAVVWGMPGELINAGGAEIIAPVHAIAERLLAMAT